VNGTSNSIGLNGAVIPASGSCTVTAPVQASAPGTYQIAVPLQALTTGPAGANALAASTSLNVVAPSSGGGGSFDWWDSLLVVGVLLAGRRHARRRPPDPPRGRR
jgi:hypothetical protein